MAMSIEFSGADDSPLQRFDGPAALEAWADEAEPMVQDALKAAAPVASGPNAGPSPGRLRNSINSERKAAESTVTLTFMANAPYAGFVVGGTQPHEIWGRGGGSLAFMYGGQLTFRKTVHHPGTKPNDFAVRAITPLLAIIQQRLEAAVADQLSD